MARKRKKKSGAGADTPPPPSPPTAPEASASEISHSSAFKTGHHDQPTPFETGSTDQQTVVVEFSEMVYLRAIFFLTLILGTLYLTYYLRSVLTPILFAWILAYLFHPVVKRIQGWGASQNFAISLVMIFLGVVGLILLIVLIPALSRSIAQISELLARMPELVQSVKVWVEKQFETQFPSTWTEVFSVWGEQLKSFAPKAIQTISRMIASLFSSGMNLLLALFHLMLIPLFMYYFLHEYEYIKERIPTYIPSRYTPWFHARFKHIDQILSGYIRGQLTVCLIVGTLYLLLLLPLRIPGAPMIALIGGLFNVIPYIGFLSIYLVALVVSALKYQLQWPFFVVMIGMITIHLVDIFYITPKIVGEQLGVSELVVILAILLGGHLFGMIGVLLAVPLAAVGKVAMMELLQRYRRSDFFLHGETAPDPTAEPKNVR